jgi:putative transposase
MMPVSCRRPLIDLPRRRRRYIATTDGDHDLPIFPNLAKTMVPDGPNQLWVADITYVAIPAGFVYVAVILDAWSRKVVSYAIGRSIDRTSIVVPPTYSSRANH